MSTNQQFPRVVRTLEKTPLQVQPGTLLQLASSWEYAPGQSTLYVVLDGLKVYPATIDGALRTSFYSYIQKA